jgi:hypothetical protein
MPAAHLAAEHRNPDWGPRLSSNERQYPQRSEAAAKARKNTKAPAQVARARVGAMETPEMIFEILGLFAASPALEIFAAREDFEE